MISSPKQQLGRGSQAKKGDSVRVSAFLPAASAAPLSWGRREAHRVLQTLQGPGPWGDKGGRGPPGSRGSVGRGRVVPGQEDELHLQCRGFRVERLRQEAVMEASHPPTLRDHGQSTPSSAWALWAPAHRGWTVQLGLACPVCGAEVNLNPRAQA